jgi:hypothetical protein
MSCSKASKIRAIGIEKARTNQDSGPFHLDGPGERNRSILDTSAGGGNAADGKFFFALRERGATALRAT